MEVLDKLYPALNASNNMFESNINALYKKDEASYNNQSIGELTSNNQYISSLRNLDEIRKFNEIRNAILSNKNLRSRNTINSLTIPSTTSDIGMIQNEQSSNINFSMDNIVQNQLINRIVNPNNKNEISNINISNLNLFNQNSILNTEKYNSPIPTSLNIMNNYCASSTSSNTNVLNGLSGYTNLNSNSILSSVQVNKPTSQLDQTSLIMNSSPLSINNLLLLKNNNLLSKDQLQLLYLAKLFKDQKDQLLSKERKSKYNSMIIPSNESVITNNFSSNGLFPLNEPIKSNLTNNLARNSITIPSTEPTINNLMNNSILIPSTESSENTSNNSFINSITIPVDSEEDSQDQLSDKLLKQFQLQEQQLASKINENSNSDEEESEISDNKKNDTLLEIPSITLNNEDFDLFKSSEIISQENYGENITNDLEDIMKLNTRQNTMNYIPLSPELSPIIKSDNINSSSNQILKNYIKKNDSNIFSSMDTLNGILSITPEMEPINSPVIETKIDNFNNNNNIQDDFVSSFIDPFKTINGEVEVNSDNLLTVDNDYLNAPATPNSVSYSSSPNNFDLTDFPNVITESFELNNDGSNNNINEDNIINSEIFNEEEQNQSSIESQDSIDKILNDLDLKEQIKNIIPAIEPVSNTKRPRGRPRKKRSEQTPKTPEEKFEQLTQSIDQILSSDLYKKLCSEERNESITNSKDQMKVSSDQDYKFIKQVNTLNYILVSYKRMCNALCKNNESDKKTISDATENQYDIPEEKMEDKREKDGIEENLENKDIVKNNNNENEEEIKEEMDSITEEEESSESENEEKSLSLLKKEILELNSNTNDERNIEEENKEAIIPIRSIETAKNGRKRKQGSDDECDSCDEEQNKRKVVRLSIKEIKNSLENGNRMSIGNGLGVNSVSALTKNGLVLVGRKRIIAENTNRPYVCSTCGAGFVRKHDLNRHEKVHTGIKNYKCPYCERAFSRNDALSRHLRVELKHRSQANEKKRGRKGNKKKATKKEN